MDKKVYTAVTVANDKTEKFLGTFTNITILLDSINKFGIDPKTLYVKGAGKRFNKVSNLTVGKQFKTVGHCVMWDLDKTHTVKIKVLQHNLNTIC